MSWILLTLVGLLTLHQAELSGIFELRLISFDNESGKDDLGKCCTGKIKPNLECDGVCRPRFRVCLKEYQAKIDATSPCTFGDVFTSDLAPNVVTEVPQNGFENSIAIRFTFTWPKIFSLIIEAWHGNQTSHFAVLVTRLMRQKLLNVGEKWTEDSHSSTYSILRFKYRVTCDSDYYGKGCEHLCRPRNDNFGHYTYSSTGERVCLAGWTGDYCNKPQCLAGCDEQHGHCNQPNECKCHPGWEGPLCNQCQLYPGCMHGTCVKPWECFCNKGWGGLFCNEDLNFCTNHKPCRNGGTCFNTGRGSYTCSCPNGFNGTDCEVFYSMAPSARVSSESKLIAEHVVVIATISTVVLFVVLAAVGVIVCLKQRRAREKARADEEARLQNEQNTANSSFAKYSTAMSTDLHMIKNSWEKCTNNVKSSNLPSPNDCSVSIISVNDCNGLPKPMH